MLYADGESPGTDRIADTVVREIVAISFHYNYHRGDLEIYVPLINNG